MSNNFPKWLYDFGWRIHELVRPPDIRGRFLEQCRAFWSEKKSAEDAVADFKRRRKEFFEGDIKSEDDKRRHRDHAKKWDRRNRRIGQLAEQSMRLGSWLDRLPKSEIEKRDWGDQRQADLCRRHKKLSDFLDAGCPGDGWYFDRYVYDPIRSGDIPHSKYGLPESEPIGSYRWAPDELHESNMPVIPQLFDYMPLEDAHQELVSTYKLSSFSKPVRRVPSIAEKYATLECVRFSVVRVDHPIDDRVDLLSEHGAVNGDILRDVDRLASESQVCGLPESARPILESFLKDVEADLASCCSDKNEPSGEQRGSTQTDTNGSCSQSDNPSLVLSETQTQVPLRNDCYYVAASQFLGSPSVQLSPAHEILKPIVDAATCAVEKLQAALAIEGCNETLHRLKDEPANHVQFGLAMNAVQQLEKSLETVCSTTDPNCQNVYHGNFPLEMSLALMSLRERTADVSEWFQTPALRMMPSAIFGAFRSVVNRLRELAANLKPASVPEIEPSRATGDAGAPEPDKRPARGNGNEPIDKPTLATAILLKEPDITPTELAKRVGVSRGTLYSKSPKWKHVRMTLTARDNARFPKGTRSSTGKLEAVDTIQSDE